MQFFLVVTGLFWVSGGFAQESLHPLKYNAQLFQQNDGSGSTRDIVFTKDTICLPFFDDFSNLDYFLDQSATTCEDTVINPSPDLIYPSVLNWLDSSAFVNRSYPILPPSYGVVTLDGLDKNGAPHNIAIDYGPADTLTSRFLYLGGTLEDSVYLSFYYQPKGYGDAPEPEDSLVLEFKKMNGDWQKIWHAVNTLADVNQSFRIAMIPIGGSDYLYDGFQFRFRNKASVKGNNDHWNIDWVYINDNRNFGDTLFRDVSFTGDIGKYLKRYRQMPWNQFKDFQADELADEMLVQLINNYNTIINTSHQFTAYETWTGTEILEPTLPISINFDPFSTTFAVYPTFEIPASVPGYDQDSMRITLKYILNPAGDVMRWNDTLNWDQQFYNYYAYDDGTAEKAYALNGVGAKLAIEFYANTPDTLKEVYIHWAHLDGDKSDKFFSLIIWDYIDTTLSSNAENILYQADFLTPKYADSINGWYVYSLTDYLGEPAPVVVNGNFYVGWLQTQADFLNVGFDVNTVANENVYFNIGGNWEQSVLPGAIMIRPQVGGNYSKYTPVAQTAAESALQIAPNPVNDQLRILNNLPAGSSVEIISLTGQIVSRQNLQSDVVPVADLAPGMYILRVSDLHSGNMRITKFIKQ